MVKAGITIKAPADRIWRALTDKEEMKEWYFDIPDFELREGAEFSFYEPGGKNEFLHRCRILEIVPEKKFSHTWTHPSHSNGSSVVTIQLHERGDNLTEVVLTHEGLESFADGGPAFAPENYQLGWEGFMAILKNYIYGIRKHTFETIIEAEAEKVWQVLVDDKSFRIWRSVLTDGAFYKGELKAGGKIQFLSPEGNGKSGYVILFDHPRNVLFQFISGVKDFVELEVDNESEKWSGFFENYVLKEREGKTKLMVEIDVMPGQEDLMDTLVPEMLMRIKMIAEEEI